MFAFSSLTFVIIIVFRLATVNHLLHQHLPQSYSLQLYPTLQFYNADRRILRKCIHD